MKAYKGFNPDMTCRGFQYKEGETYETDKATLCKLGFHAYEDPIDCFSYYSPSDSAYHEVELDGVDEERDEDSKVAAKKITIGAKIDLSSMIRAGIDFRFSKTTIEKSGQATGSSGAASATGDSGAASATGKAGIALAAGVECKAMGSLGCWIVLTERVWDNEGQYYRIKEVRALEVDGVNVKPEVLYMLKNGELVEL